VPTNRKQQSSVSIRRFSFATSRRHGSLSQARISVFPMFSSVFGKVKSEIESDNYQREKKKILVNHSRLVCRFLTNQFLHNQLWNEVTKVTISRDPGHNATSCHAVQKLWTDQRS
jgi:hypothetical protein